MVPTVRCPFGWADAAELDQLLVEYSYPPMVWDTARKGERSCPAVFRHWRHLKGLRELPRRGAATGAAAEEEGLAGGEVAQNSERTLR